MHAATALRGKLFQVESLVEAEQIFADYLARESFATAA